MQTAAKKDSASVVGGSLMAVNVDAVATAG
jgi:hypothetical protein